MVCRRWAENGDLILYIHRRVQAFRQTIGAFIYHDLRKSMMSSLFWYRDGGHIIRH